MAWKNGELGRLCHLWKEEHITLEHNHFSRVVICTDIQVDEGNVM